MSFPIGSGILTPIEFDVVHRVFSEISSQQWFTVSCDRREQFAVLVMDSYRKGIMDPDTLEEYCRNIAFTKFGNGGLRHSSISTSEGS